MCILLIDTNWLHVIVQPPYSKGCLTQYARSIDFVEKGSSKHNP